MSSAGAGYSQPALFTSRSILPWRSRTSFDSSASTWSSSRMSQACRLHAAVSESELDRLVERVLTPPAHHHVRPERGQLERGGSPSPDPPPLTTATCPSRSPGWKIFDGIAAGSYPPRLSAEVLTVEAERDVVRRLGARHFLEGPRVQHQQERALRGCVEHHGEDHAVVLRRCAPGGRRRPARPGSSRARPRLVSPSSRRLDELVDPVRALAVPYAYSGSRAGCCGGS